MPEYGVTGEDILRAKTAWEIRKSESNNEWSSRMHLASMAWTQRTGTRVHGYFARKTAELWENAFMAFNKKNNIEPDTSNGHIGEDIHLDEMVAEMTENQEEISSASIKRRAVPVAEARKAARPGRMGRRPCCP